MTLRMRVTRGRRLCRTTEPMSHQLSFRATPKDLFVLETEFMRAHGCTCLAWRSPVPVPRQLSSFSSYEPGVDDLTVFLTSSDTLDEVVLRHVAAQGYWTVDTLRSPVLELGRCFIEGNALRRGRLYYADGYYGASREWVLKPERFRQWATSLLKTARRVFRRVDGEYVGAEAAHMSVLPESGAAKVLAG